MEAFTRYIPFLIPIVILELGLLAVALADLIRREKVKGPKCVWALVIVFIQMLGPILYLLLGRDEE